LLLLLLKNPRNLAKKEGGRASLKRLVVESHPSSVIQSERKSCTEFGLSQTLRELETFEK
jgi:hypothetical protein